VLKALMATNSNKGRFWGGENSESSSDESDGTPVATEEAKVCLVLHVF
jgi:hypothetical protein